MSDWQTILAQHAVIPSDPGCADLGNERAEVAAAIGGDTVTPLAHLQLFRASGGDTREFLQGQLSNDIRLVDESHGQLSSYNSPKGRMMASFRLFERDGAIMMQIPGDIAEATMKRLRMFIMRSDVTLDLDQGLLALGISGNQASAALTDKLSCPLPDEVDGVVTAGDATVIRIASADEPRLMVVAPATTTAELWQAVIASGATPIGTTAWQLLDIRAGLPSISDATRESFVAQMVNFHLVNGVNFKKGCYPGQEVVARMQYLGKLKRRMYRVHVDSDSRPQPGDAIHSPDKEGGQGAGSVVMAAPAESGGYELLVVLDVKTMEQGPLHLQNNEGPVLEILDLPYPFEQQESA